MLTGLPPQPAGACPLPNLELFTVVKHDWKPLKVDPPRPFLSSQVGKAGLPPLFCGSNYDAYRA